MSGQSPEGEGAALPLTPEEEEFYDRVTAELRRPRVTSPHKAGVVYHGDEPSVVREERPNREAMHAVPRERQRALILCRNVKGRPSVLAVLVTSQGDGIGRVFRINAPDIESPFGTALGQDFAVDCRCGMEHQIDGGRLRSALLSLPRRKGGKPPTVDVFSVERVIAE